MTAKGPLPALAFFGYHQLWSGAFSPAITHDATTRILPVGIFLLSCPQPDNGTSPRSLESHKSVLLLPSIQPSPHLSHHCHSSKTCIPLLPTRLPPEQRPPSPPQCATVMTRPWSTQTHPSAAIAAGAALMPPVAPSAEHLIHTISCYLSPSLVSVCTRRPSRL